MSRALLGHPWMLLIATLLLSSRVEARDAAPLTRADAIRQALERSPELRAERERLGLEEAQLLRARQLLQSNPELEAKVGSDWPFKHTGEQLLEVELSQELEIAGQRGLRKAEAETRLRAAQARVRALETRTGREASEAWLRLWQAERHRSLAEQALELSRTLEKAAESRFQAGDIPELDRNAVTVDVARAERAAATAESARVRARLELARLLGRSEAEAAALSVEDEPALEPPAATLEALQNLAREQRADLASAKDTERAAEALVRLRSRERVPNPTLRIAYERQTQRIGSFTDLDQHLKASVLLPLPFWNRGQAELRAATAERGAAAVEREAAERQVNAEVAAAFSSVEQTQRALEALSRTLPLTQRNLELVRRAFEAGQVDLLLLLNARDRAQQAQQEYVEARVEYGRALDELMRATGRLPMEVKP